ncbi:MAG: toxin-antitoxin system YwqK family antitoxin [Fluviicola sp.]
MKYAVLVLGLLATLRVNAQDHLKDFTLKRSLKQDGLHLQFMVLDADKKGVKHHKPNKFYYWTKAQHVRATQGASSGLLLHGLLEAFYPDKQLAKKGKYHKGLKHGTWRYWNSNGTFQRVENWRQGTRIGKQQYFDENGNLIQTEFIHKKRRKIVQPDSVIQWRLFNRRTITIFDSTGQISEVQHLKNGKLHGTQKQFVDGKLDSKKRFKKGEQIEKAQEPESQNDEQFKDNDDNEPGKIAQLWNKLFKKEKQDKGEKQEKKKRESKRNSKGKNAGGEK